MRMIAKKYYLHILLISVLVLPGCAGKMPPPVYDTRPLIEKTPKEIQAAARTQTLKKDQVATQKKNKEKAQAAIKELAKAISKARQNRIDELSNYNFEKVRRLYKEVVDSLDTELYTEAIANATKAQEILAVAYDDAKLQLQHAEELERKESSLREIKAEEEEQLQLAEEQAETAVKQATVTINKIEDSGIAKQFPASFKESKSKLEEAFKALKSGNFPQASADANEVILTAEEMRNKSKELAKLPQVTEPVDNDEQWRQIKLYLEKYSYGKAYFALNEYLSNFPQTSHIEESMFIFGRCFEEFDSFDRALSAYARLIDKFPESPFSEQAIFHSSLIYSTINNYNLALQQIEKLASLENANNLKDKELFARGKLEFSRKNHAVALLDFEVINNDYKDSELLPDSLKMAAECQLVLERKDEAAKRYRQIYQQFPQSQARKRITEPLSKLIYAEARELTKGNEIEASRAKYRQVIADFSDSTLLDNATYWLAETYYVEGDFQNALTRFKEVLTNDYYDYTDSSYLKDDDATLKIGYCYYNLKEYDKAIQTFSELLENYPDSEFKSDANYWLKLTQSQQKR